MDSSVSSHQPRLFNPDCALIPPLQNEVIAQTGAKHRYLHVWDKQEGHRMPALDGIDSDVPREPALSRPSLMLSFGPRMYAPRAQVW